MPTLATPESTYRNLVLQAAKQNITVDDLAARLLADTVADRDGYDQMLDTDDYAECAANTTPVPTPEEVRAALANIPGNMSAAIIAERDERF